MTDTNTYQKITVSLVGRDDTAFMRSSSNRGIVYGVLLTMFSQITPIKLDFEHHSFTIGDLTGSIKSSQQAVNLDELLNNLNGDAYE